MADFFWRLFGDRPKMKSAAEFLAEVDAQQAAPQHPGAPASQACAPPSPAAPPYALPVQQAFEPPPASATPPYALPVQQTFEPPPPAARAAPAAPVAPRAPVAAHTFEPPPPARTTPGAPVAPVTQTFEPPPPARTTPAAPVAPRAPVAAHTFEPPPPARTTPAAPVAPVAPVAAHTFEPPPPARTTPGAPVAPVAHTFEPPPPSRATPAAPVAPVAPVAAHTFEPPPPARTTPAAPVAPVAAHTFEPPPAAPVAPVSAPPVQAAAAPPPAGAAPGLSVPLPKFASAQKVQAGFGADALWRLDVTLFGRKPDGWDVVRPVIIGNTFIMRRLLSLEQDFTPLAGDATFEEEALRSIEIFKSGRAIFDWDDLTEKLAGSVAGRADMRTARTVVRIVDFAERNLAALEAFAKKDWKGQQAAGLACSSYVFKDFPDPRMCMLYTAMNIRCPAKMEIRNLAREWNNFGYSCWSLGVEDCEARAVKELQKLGFESWVKGWPSIGRFYADKGLEPPPDQGPAVVVRAGIVPHLEKIFGSERAGIVIDHLEAAGRGAGPS